MLSRLVLYVAATTCILGQTLHAQNAQQNCKPIRVRRVAQGAGNFVPLSAGEQKFAAGLKPDPCARENEFIPAIARSDLFKDYNAANLQQLDKREKPDDEMAIHLIWSRQDTGYVEPYIQREWYYNLKIWNACINAPGAKGRQTAMLLAIADAKQNKCGPAYAIAETTQWHNSEATDVLRRNRKFVCDYLRSMK